MVQDWPRGPSEGPHPDPGSGQRGGVPPCTKRVPGPQPSSYQDSKQRLREKETALISRLQLPDLSAGTPLSLCLRLGFPTSARLTLWG